MHHKLEQALASAAASIRVTLKTCDQQAPVYRRMQVSDMLKPGGQGLEPCKWGECMGSCCATSQMLCTHADLKTCQNQNKLASIMTVLPTEGLLLETCNCSNFP